MQDDYPVFHLTCITHRKDPIYAATVVGKPPMEDAWMGKAVERIFLPLMQLTCPRSSTSTSPPRASSTT
jgi:4-hydroxy-3-polyprenylbenzoate decarboxylase